MAKKATHAEPRLQASRFALLDLEPSDNQDTDEVESASEHDGSDESFALQVATTAEANSGEEQDPSTNSKNDASDWKIATHKTPHKRVDSHHSTLQGMATVPHTPRTASTKKSGMHSSNWRDHGPANISLYRTINGVSFAIQVVGAIVSRLEAREISFSHVPREGETIGEIGGVRVLVKRRLFLIIGRQDLEITEFAIYTYGNQGLVNKPRKEDYQYNSIRPFDVAAKDFVNQSPEQKVLVVAKMYHPKDKLRATSIVRWAHPKSRSIDCANLKVIALLTSESTRFAVERAKAAMGKFEE